LNLILSNAIRASVHGMLKTISADLAKEGIRVNAVQPGRIATDRLIQLDTDTAKRQGTTPDAVRKRYEEQVIPMGRYGRPEAYPRPWSSSPRRRRATSTVSRSRWTAACS